MSGSLSCLSCRLGGGMSRGVSRRVAGGLSRRLISRCLRLRRLRVGGGGLLVIIVVVVVVIIVVVFTISTTTTSSSSSSTTTAAAAAAAQATQCTSNSAKRSADATSSTLECVGRVLRHSIRERVVHLAQVVVDLLDVFIRVLVGHALGHGPNGSDCSICMVLVGLILEVLDNTRGRSDARAPGLDRAGHGCHRRRAASTRRCGRRMASLFRLGSSLGRRLVRWLRGRVLTLGRRVGLSCLLRVLRLARGLCRGALVRRLTFLLGSRTLGCWLVLGLRSGILVLRLASRLRRRLLAGLTLWLRRWVLILGLARCRVSLRGD